MTDDHSFTRLLHRATHRIPGVPTHAERPAGHQGDAQHGRARRRGDAPQPSRPSPNNRWNRSPAHPPRVMAAWQRRIAALFGQDL
ncbi:MAG TPA: hypothetical protein VGJ63_00955 [Micromonosporaceae bacterium]